MFYRITLHTVFLSLCLGYSLRAFQGVEKDTSYTINAAYLKYKKRFAEIKIVKPKKNENVLEVEYVMYKKSITGNLYFDAYINTEQNTPNPAVVLIHGGGWKSGDKSLLKPLAQHIAREGYSCFTIAYRLSDEAIYPAGIYDVKDAIRYIKKNAKRWYVDSSKIAVLGCSSGGQMASLVGTTNNSFKYKKNEENHISSSVQAIVNLDGIIAFKHPKSKEGKLATLWLGGSYEEEPEIWKEASALTHTDKNTPPILFINSPYERFHAGRDDMIKILNTYTIDYQVETFVNSPHTFWLFHPWFDKTVEYITTFLNKILKSN